MRMRGCQCPPGGDQIVPDAGEFYVRNQSGKVTPNGES